MPTNKNKKILLILFFILTGLSFVSNIVLYTNNNPIVPQQTPLALSPVLECVTNLGNNSYSAFFGYNNNNSELTIQVGANNKFTSGNEDRGQNTVFLAGRQVATFSVNFVSNETLTWRLVGPDNIARTSTASANSSPCQNNSSSSSISSSESSSESSSSSSVSSSVSSSSSVQSSSISSSESSSESSSSSSVSSSVSSSSSVQSSSISSSESSSESSSSSSVSSSVSSSSSVQSSSSISSSESSSESSSSSSVSSSVSSSSSVQSSSSISSSISSSESSSSSSVSSSVSSSSTESAVYENISDIIKINFDPLECESELTGKITYFGNNQLSVKINLYNNEFSYSINGYFVNDLNFQFNTEKIPSGIYNLDYLVEDNFGRKLNGKMNSVPIKQSCTIVYEDEGIPETFLALRGTLTVSSVIFVLYIYRTQSSIKS
jgi:hypothetical protein